MRTHGVGAVPCEYMIVSDYPGQKESVQGVPLVGKVGDEVNRYLDGVTLPRRGDWFLCNLIREWNPSNEYATADVERDEPELLADLEMVQPKVIVTLGRWSSRYFLGDIDMEEVQGIPWVYENSLWLKEPATVVPIFNPAAGFRSPETQAHVSHGFRELALFLDGKTEPRELFKDAYPNPTYLEITDPRWIPGALMGVRTIHIDTEGHPDEVWSVQFCVQPGTAYLVRLSHRQCVSAFCEWLLRERPRVVYHGSLHDLSIFRQVLRVLNLPLEALYGVEFDDTQVMAYLLQLEPIGLKPNCVRHCNMRMQSYDDVLGDAQLQLAQEYLIKVFDIEQAEYAARQQAEFKKINQTPLVDKDGKVRRDKTGAIRYRHTTVLPQPARTDLHKAAERVLRSREPYKLWQKQALDLQVAAYNLEVAV